jgi:hypothetical protein
MKYEVPLCPVKLYVPRISYIEGKKYEKHRKHGRCIENALKMHRKCIGMHREA